jgi:hypothetical protein
MIPTSRDILALMRERQSARKCWAMGESASAP